MQAGFGYFVQIQAGSEIEAGPEIQTGGLMQLY